MNVNSLRTLQTEKGAFVILLTNKEYPYLPPFKQIRDAAKKEFKEAESRLVAKKEIEKILPQLKSQQLSKTALSEQNQHVWQTVDSLTITQRKINDLGSVAALLNQLKTIEINQFLPPYPVNAGYALIHLLEKQEPEASFIEKNFEDYKDRLFSLKAQQVANSRLQAILQEAKIENYLYTNEDSFSHIQ